jgi:hypothetical protein
METGWGFMRNLEGFMQIHHKSLAGHSARYATLTLYVA